MLDTNVVSELRKREAVADASVRTWARDRIPAELHLSAITILEVEQGILRIERRDPEQAQRLRRWLEHDLIPTFQGRILPVDLPVVRAAARLHVPDPQPERDALIAATAIAHHLTLVSRNTSDFKTMGVPIINPWVRRTTE